MPPTRRIPASSATVALALLFAGALLAGGGGFAAERALFLWLAHAGTPILGTLVLFTRLGNVPVLTPIAIGIAIGLGRWRGARLGWGYAGAVLLGRLMLEMVKFAVHRPRPLLLPHLDLVGDWSFPSAHAGMTTIAYVGGAMLSRDPWLIRFALLIALLVGLSRVMLAVHWPSDVVAGWSLGGLWTIGMARLLGPWTERPPAAP